MKNCDLFHDGARVNKETWEVEIEFYIFNCVS